jgi:N-acetylmuramoyl-L-alanine amidase
MESQLRIKKIDNRQLNDRRFKMKKIVTLFLSIFIFSCAVNPYRKSEKTYNKQLKSLIKTISKKDTVHVDNRLASKFIGTTNFNLRKPNFVIIHHTAQDSLAQTIKTFTLTRTQVSAHYIIADDGRIVQMLNDYMRAWHAGSGTWSKNADINSCSIGIELDNNGVEPFSENQIKSLLALLTKLKKDYNIPAQNFIGHSDIAPTRKNDPSKMFPWKLLSEKGFGLWQKGELVPAPATFDAEIGLKLIGYDTKNREAAIQAFKLHFNQNQIDGILDQPAIDLIYNIYLQSL